MRLAALYDIHGNLPALEAVLAEVAAEDVDMVLVGGDVVPGPMPAACLKRLRSLPVPVRCLMGNGEVDVLRFRAGETPDRVPEAFHPGMRWCAEALDGETAEWLRGWPRTQRVEVSGSGEVLFCHATPRDENEIFTLRTPEERLRPVFLPAQAEWVVCGHTHMQFRRYVGGVQVVNAGSVGMPFGEPGAFWAVVGEGGVDLRRTDYDLREAAERCEATGYPDSHGLRLEDPPDADAMLDAFEAAALR